MEPNDLYDTVYLQERCPQCGAKVEELSKDTASGRDLRFFKCTQCAWSGFVDVGLALWKALSQANTSSSPD